MQRLAEICIRRPIFAAMLILAMMTVGSVGYHNLGVDRFPPVELPSVRVSTSLPGASPEEMEVRVTQPLEEVVNTVPGIQELRSISTNANSILVVTFDLSRDIDVAAQDVRDRVASAARDLPPDVDPPVISKFDNESSPVITVALSGPRPLRELTELADRLVKVQLERTTGVGNVDVVGGAERAINIWLNPERLAAYGLSVGAVRAAIARQNADVPGGLVTSRLTEWTLRTMGRITDPRAFNELVVASVAGTPVTIQDIGRAEDGTKEQRTAARFQGTPCVTLEVRRQVGANTVALVEATKDKLPALAAALPEDVKLEVIEDQSRYIHQALHEINVHLVLGSILACLVVLLFMRNWRATVIAAVAIPTSVVSTFGVMWALGFTLNSVTMLSLVLMVGIVIDDAIVVLENIHRFAHEKGMHPADAAREATAEIGLAVLATTLSLVVIFVPVSFMSSISGRFLYQFGLTAGVAVMVSLLVSFTLTPMMCARMLQTGAHADPLHPPERGGFYGSLERAYLRLLGLCMRHRAPVVLVAVLTVASIVPLYGLIPQEYIPSGSDEGEFEVRVTAREGTSLAAMDQALGTVEETLREVPGIRALLVTAGSGLGLQANAGRIYVLLQPHAERVFSLTRLLSLDPAAAFRGNRSQQQVIQDVRVRLKKLPDLRFSVRPTQTFNIGGGNSDIDFAFLGPDLETLSGYAVSLRERAPELGIVDADTTLRLDKPELRVQVDRARMAALGVQVEEVATALRLMVGGDTRVSRFHDASVNDDYDVQLRLADGQRNDPAAISRLHVADVGGRLVRLDTLARVTPALTASRIDRMDRQRQVSLRASVAPGFALADRLAALREAATQLDMPAGYSTRISGRGREMERTLREFLLAFLLSILLMYMILASQFDSLVHPFTILLSLPLTLPFALLSVWLTGDTLNLYSALGILVLMGVVKKNAILQIDHMNALQAHGLDRLSAVMQGNRDRLRPILMTTLALVAGMIPLAVGTGPGAAERRGIAVIVIGGQTLSLVLTLVVTPVVYSLLDELVGHRAPRPAAKNIHAAAG